ncbi:hypothetical protein [Lysobacter sp. P5_B9]
MPIAQWLPFVLDAQLLLLLFCAWIAVRLATRPLARLASAADPLNLSGDGARLQADGPAEVAKAMTAFNAMQDRIARHVRERLQILAAISHDLQTPITRMKLGSRNRDTGGAGLGLAIAQQLAISIGGTLSLCNRKGGGLEAVLVLNDVARIELG